jgi:eight-cysteine-cluster-containing protein
MKKICLSFLISFLILIFPVLCLADRGMMVWPPEVRLDQSAQNAIVAWNGQEEIIILSVDVESSTNITALGIIPLPSNPSDVKEGSFESFDKLIEIMDRKMEDVRNQWGTLGKRLGEAPSDGVEITFHKEIGAHDVTIVKVNDLDYFLGWIEDFANEKGLEVKEISSEFKAGIASYLKRDIKYFVFDVIEAGQEKESIKPLIYHFDSDFLYFPILISGVSEIKESQAEINLFIITEKEVEFPDIPYSYYSYHWPSSYGYPVELTQEELKEVSQDIASLFNGAVNAREASLYGRLNDLKRDLMIYPYVWDKNLGLGSFGEEVRSLQKVLINEGVWGAEVGATGYFGQITKTALAKFQEKYKQDILKPLNLEFGTGYFGSKTKDYLKRLSLLGEPKEPEPKEFIFNQNLSLGMKGEDVKALQEILIKEGVWLRPGIKATGYFGFITKEALIKYQEKYASEILEPIGLRNGTGFFGSFTRDFFQKQIELGKYNEYYGYSIGSCEIDADCYISGCNSEICQSKNEEPLVSICVIPDEPTPKQLDYECKCLENKCQWVK